MLRYKKLVYFVCLLGLSFSLKAQMYNEITSTVFLQNGKIITKPGAAPMKANILIKDGVIIAIGSTISPPFDAKVISIDSHFVYAGFIDMLNHTGIKRDEPTPQAGRGGGGGQAQQGPRTVPGQATLEQSGVTPQKSVVKVYSGQETAVKDMRNQGVTVTHVVPTGLMLPGKGSVISLKDGGRTDAQILRKDVSTYARLAPARSYAPGTVIGVMSKFRDVYKNAEILQKNSMSFDAGKEGVTRPAYAEEYNAMFPVVNKKEPVFFDAPDVKDIHKVMILQKELGFNLVLSNVTNVNGILDEVKKLNSPLILSLKLPDPIKKDSADTKKKTEEEINIAKRSEEAYKSLVSQAGMLEKAGVKFAFGMKDVKAADIKKSVKTLIDNGLSETQALAALTTQGAELVGMASKLGTVEVGKLANLVVCDTSYFSEKSKIKFVLVEGQVFEQKQAERAKKSDKPSEKGIAGKYSYAINVMGNNETGWVNIDKKGADIKITVKSDQSNDVGEDISKVELSGNNLKFLLNTDIGGSPITVNFDLRFDEDEYSGTANIGGFGSFPITGKRIPE
jgi:hypothetical protein